MGESGPAEADYDPEDLASRLTWIWGSPRSGSSWLLELLSHPLEVDMNAPLGFRTPSPDEEQAHPLDVIPVDELSFASHLAPWDGNPVEVFGKWLPGSVINFSEGRPTYLLSKRYEDAWRPQMRELLLRRLDALVRDVHASVPNVAARPAVLIKETPTTHGADRVMDLLPESRALLLIRDPRDVVDSLMHAFRPGGFMANQFGVSFEGDSRAEGTLWAARHWATCTDVGLQMIEQHDPALSRVIRYEDLLADTEVVVGETLAWMGIERSPERVAATVADLAFDSLPPGHAGELKRNRSATPGLWRQNLSPEEIETVDSVVGDRLEDLGYEH